MFYAWVKLLLPWHLPAADTVMCCRYQPRSIDTKVRAILSTSGFLDSTEAAPEGPLGIVLEQTPFYAGMRFSLQILAQSCLINA